MEGATLAAGLAADLLRDVGARLAHSRRVAQQAAAVCRHVDEPWRSALVDAAWLHDVGYSPALVVTGFHPLDGARWLKSQGWRSEVCRLVAWHTRAGTEAGLRGLGDALVDEFPPPPEAVQAVLTWADLTSSPAGECCTPTARLEDILVRYSPGSVVRQATAANLLEFLKDVRRIEAYLESRLELVP